MSLHYKLLYFPCRGRGEALRYIFAQADIQYDNHVVPFEEWPKVKPTTPIGHLPILEFEGKQLSQSTTIARYLAHKYGLAGKSDWDVAYCDMLVQCIEDVYPPFRPFVLALFAKDEAKKVEEWAKYKDGTMKPALEKFEHFLGDKKFFCGDYVTYADLCVAELINRIETCFDKELVKHFPKLHEHSTRVHELPNIKKYVDKRPCYPF